MSNLLKKLSLLTFTFLLGWYFASLGDKFISNKHQTRTLASLKNQSTIMMEKHLMPVTVSLNGPETFPDGPQEEVLLQAHIKTPFDDFNRIHWKWSLPQDVQIVEGQTQGEVENPVAGHVYVLEIRLNNFDRQYRKEVTLEAFVRDHDGTHLGSTANITSRPEDSMEHLAPVMMVKAQEFQKNELRQPASASTSEQLPQ